MTNLFSLPDTFFYYQLQIFFVQNEGREAEIQTWTFLRECEEDELEFNMIKGSRWRFGMTRPERNPEE